MSQAEGAQGNRTRVGCLPILVVVVIGLVAFGSCQPKNPCDEASNARAIANSTTGHDHDVAALQAAVKQAECDAQG